MVEVRTFDRAMNLDELLSALCEQERFAGVDGVHELSRRRNAGEKIKEGHVHTLDTRLPIGCDTIGYHSASWWIEYDLKNDQYRICRLTNDFVWPSGIKFAVIVD